VPLPRRRQRRPSSVPHCAALLRIVAHAQQRDLKSIYNNRYIVAAWICLYFSSQKSGKLGANKSTNTVLYTVNNSNCIDLRVKIQHIKRVTVHGTSLRGNIAHRCTCSTERPEALML
jgi:hypothetical protein